MATIDLGKIKLVWKGTYAGGTAYVPDDVVAYTDGSVTSTYICTTASTGNAPSSGGTAHGSWAYMAKGQATSPTTTQGDIIYRGASADARLAKGTAGQVLKMNSGATAPEWGTDLGGSLIQTQCGTLTGNSNLYSSTNARVDTGLNVTITPTKAGSKLWVVASGWSAHANPGAAGLNQQSTRVYLEQNVNSAGFTEPDGTAATGTESMWQMSDTQNADHDWKDFFGCFTHFWAPTYTLGNAIQLRITYGPGWASGTEQRYFHHSNASGGGSLMHLVVSEIN